MFESFARFGWVKVVVCQNGPRLGLAILEDGGDDVVARRVSSGIVGGRGATCGRGVVVLFSHPGSLLVDVGSDESTQNTLAK